MPGGKGGKKKAVKANTAVAEAAQPKARKPAARVKSLDDAASDESDGDADAASAQVMALDEQSQTRVTKELQKRSKSTSVARGGAKTGVLYLGHIPHGFYEDQMRGFFSQFGMIKRLRLARNKKTGRSKHFAFIEFEHVEVARIVAKSMHGYLMFSKVLACQLLPPEQVHPDTFKHAIRQGASKAASLKREKKRHDKARSPEARAAREKRVVKSEQRKRKKLEALGIDYEFGGYEEAVATRQKRSKRAEGRAAKSSD